MNEPEHLVPSQNQLGETPIWAPEENALYWVDWGGGPICRYELATGKFTTFPVSAPVTALARRASGGWIAIAQNGLYEWNAKTNVSSSSSEHPGRTSRRFATTMARWIDRGACWSERLTCRTPSLLKVQYTAWTLMAHFMSSTQVMPRRTVSGSARMAGRFTWQTSGIVRSSPMTMIRPRALSSNRRVFARVPDEDGMPDGLIVDSEGFVWSGHWAGWKLTRYDPAGKIERQIRFPVQHVISFAFGGKDLDELFVTTAWWGFSDEERKQQPWAGDLFHVNTGVTGLVEPAFAG